MNDTQDKDWAVNTIRVKKTTKENLDDIKKYKRESYDDVIIRLLDIYWVLKKLKNRIQEERAQQVKDEFENRDMSFITKLFDDLWYDL